MFDNLMRPTVPGVVGEVDNLFKDAVNACCQYDRASASLLQRRLSIGYARAARLIDQLQDAGVLAPSDGSSKPRAVLIKSYKDLDLGDSKIFEEKVDYVAPVNYIPRMASFLPDSVKKLDNCLDIPYLETDFSKIGNLIVTGDVISKKFEFIKTYLLFILSKFKLDDINLMVTDQTGLLNRYNIIPHLLFPIITEHAKSTSAFRWLLREMNRRADTVIKNKKAKFPVIVYIFIGDTFSLYENDLEMAIKILTSRGAYHKIHLMLVGDRLGDFMTMIKDNIPARLEFDVYGESEAVFSFKKKTKIKIPILGEGVIEDYLDKLKTS